MINERASEWLPSVLVPFLTLSYPVATPAEPDSFPTSNYYRAGLLDLCIFVTCIAVMAVLRDMTRLFVMEPFAHWYLTRSARLQAIRLISSPPNGVVQSYPPEKGRETVLVSKRQERTIRRSVLRFAEQGWSMVYYTFTWSYGLYIHCNLPTAPFNPAKAWENYPHTLLAGPLKFYYLMQTAFYMHQVLILNAEARRKDHWQMMTHHVITIVLMIISYFYNFTRVGVLILVIMDFCDIFLPLAKMFRYLSMPLLCDATFTFFLVSWFLTRHVLFILVIKSTYSDSPYYIPHDWIPEREYYYTYEVWFAFMTMLVSLQLIQMLWFWMICRVAWRVISGQGADDTRSDDEDDDNIQEVTEDTDCASIPHGSSLKRRR